MMSYKNDDTLVIINKYSKASGIAKNELYETYDRIRDLTVSGPTIGGSGLGKFGSLLVNLARTFGSTSFSPTLGSEAMTIPGTNYYAPISGGAGVIPGGQAAFGLAPFSMYTGFPTGGAAPVNGLSLGSGLQGFSLQGIGSLGSTDNLGFGSLFFDESDYFGGLSEGSIVGGASPIDNFASTAGGTAIQAAGAVAGTAAGTGFGRNWVMPLAGLASGVGGLLSTLGPFFGPLGLAGAAAGSILNGAAGAVLSSFEHVSNRLLANADVILTNKVHNLETTVKMLDTQTDVLKKLMKEAIEGEKKSLDNL
jgi:hypothetical protein